MPPFSSLHKILDDHPVFLSISIIKYGEKAVSHNLIGSGKVYLNFLYGDFKKVNSDGTEPELGNSNFQPVENHFSFHADSRAKLITLGLRPYYWYNFTEESAKLSFNKHFNLSDCIPVSYVNLIYQELKFIDCPDLAIQLIDKYLNIYYAKWKKLNPVADIVEEIFYHQGNLSIQEILEKYRISRRTLNSNFDKYIGVPPKFFIRLVHFNNLMRDALLEKVTIAKIIKNWNYYDYSHFKKDFLLFTGIPPKNLDKFKDGTLNRVFKDFSYW